MRNRFEWELHGPILLRSIRETLYMVSGTMLIGGFLGLILGIVLYTTRRGGLLANPFVFTIANLAVNIVRPIPFIILLAAAAPLTLVMAGTTIGSTSMLVPMSLAVTFGAARIVEQNLVTIDPGVIEAARATGATRWRIITTLLVPEALGPLILGFTFVFVAVIDMSAVAGIVGGGGLGDFAIQYGHRRWNTEVVWITMLVIIVIVQVVQAIGNRLARYVLRR